MTPIVGKGVLLNFFFAQVKTLLNVKTKICDFPYPFSDLTHKLIPIDFQT